LHLSLWPSNGSTIDNLGLRRRGFPLRPPTSGSSGSTTAVQPGGGIEIGETQLADLKAQSMREVGDVMDSMPPLQGAVVRRVAAGRVFGDPQWADTGGQGRGTGLQQLEHRALEGLVHRLGRSATRATI
jgi:hypothetical protein